MVLGGRAIYGDEIQALRRTMEAETWQLLQMAAACAGGCAGRLPRRIVGDIKLARPMKIVVDCGNGIAGASAPGHPSRAWAAR
jgi:phosphomannomutase